MRMHLAYGRTGLDVDVDPARTDVVRPAHRPAAADPAAELQRALRQPVAGPPLRDRVAPGSTVAISVCDITRAQPRELMVNAVLTELEGLVARTDVTVVVATGTHRANTDAELRAMLGDEIVDTVRIVNHDARDPETLTWRGTHNGVPVWLNRDWCEADVRITTGFVEPHFFAGFSGGPKLVVPGLAGLDTVTAWVTCAVAYLAGHPDRRDAIAADLSLVPAAVEELLRWESIVPAVPRVAMTDVEISGETVRAGESVMCMIGAANIDPGEFPDADVVDLERPGNRHLAFGGGLHRCLGSHLARLEMRVALEEIHRRLPDYAVKDGETLRYTMGIRAVDYLPLVFAPVSPA